MQGKVAIITGASSGIGAETALHFAKLGANLTLVGRNELRLKNVLTKCTILNPSIGVQCVVADVSLEKNGEIIVAKTLEKFGKIDILINGAGIIAVGSIETTNMEQFDTVMNTNLRAIYNITMLAVPHLIKTKGAIVNISSVNGMRAFPGVLAYCISKAAVDQFTRSIALELGPKGVRVNSVNPGVVITEIHKTGGMNDKQYQEFLERTKVTHALGRPGEVNEVAEAIAFLATSKSSSFITATNLPVDGGRHAMQFSSKNCTENCLKNVTVTVLLDAFCLYLRKFEGGKIGMKCVLSSFNAKVFAKAVQALSRIGAELFVEGTPEGLSMRTVNNTKSAFALFKFLPEFFLDYETEHVSNDEFENKCKVSMKACLGIFKNMKQVEYCNIAIDSKNSKLMVQLRCRLDTVKTNYISIIDTETLQAVYTTKDVPNKLRAPCRLFTEISSNFQVNEEEVTLEAGGDSLKVKNYVEGSDIDKRFMRSQLTLKANEFEEYSVKQETSITFCLREFRAFLGFAEANNLDISVNFESGGRPAVFVVENSQKLEANLVTSTLNPEDVTMYECNFSRNISIDDVSYSASQKRASSSRNEQSTKKKTRLVNKANDTGTNPLFTLESGPVADSVDIVRAQPQYTNPQSAFLSRPQLESVESAENSIPSQERPVNRLLNSRENYINKTHEDCSGINVTFKNTGESEPPLDESVPKSPTSVRRTKTRRVFKRCFEATFNPTVASRPSEILAKNSDTED